MIVDSGNEFGLDGNYGFRHFDLNAVSASDKRRCFGINSCALSGRAAKGLDIGAHLLKKPCVFLGAKHIGVDSDGNRCVRELLVQVDGSDFAVVH